MNIDSAAALVFRTGLINDIPRAACVFWTICHRHDWYRAHYEQWVDASISGDDRNTKFRMTSASSTEWAYSDPLNLRKDEDFVVNAPISDQVLLARIQNKTLLDIEEWLLELPIPYVITTPEIDAMQIYECDFELIVNEIGDLADAEMSFEEDPSSNTKSKYPIPSSAWLPANVAISQTDFPAFYNIISAGKAFVALPERVAHGSQRVKLVRRCTNRCGKTFESAVAIATPISLAK